MLISDITTQHAQAYNDLTIIGYSWEQHGRDTLLREFVDPAGSQTRKNETATFRIITYKMEKWKNILAAHKDVDAKLMPWPRKGTVIWISKKKDNMNLAELSMLYHIMTESHNNPFLIDSDESSSGRISTMARSVAKCNVHTTTYFCCDEVTENLINPLNMISDTEAPSPGSFDQGKWPHYWIPKIFASAAEHRHHDIYQHHAQKSHGTHQAHKLQSHPHHAFLKHRKKHVSRRKYELLKQRRKHEALQRSRKEASDILELPMARRKLLCKYRKSCYESGIVPNTWNINNLLPRFLQRHPLAAEMKTEIPTTMDNETKAEISEAELKLLCRYRKSCYEEVGAEIERLYVNIQVVPMLARRFAIALPPKKQKTIKEIADIALAKVEEREKIAALRPIPKKVIIDKKLNEIEEQMKKRLACKYRKSCYESGILPEIGSSFSNLFPRLHNFLKRQIYGSQTQETIHKEFSDFEENEKKIFCKYRKSCYSTGVKPAIQHDQMFQYVHIVKTHEVLIPLEIRCKYRKSCYETGVLPELTKKKTIKEETLEMPKVPVQKVTSLYELKLHCKYRKSCYRQKAEEPQNASAELFEEIAKMDRAEAKAERKKTPKETIPPLPPKKPKATVKPTETEAMKVKPERKAAAPTAEKVEKPKIVAEKGLEKVPKSREVKKTEEKPIKRPKTGEAKKKTIKAKAQGQKVSEFTQKPKKKKVKEPRVEVPEEKSTKKSKKITPPPTAKPVAKKEALKSKKVEKEKKEAPKPKRVEREMKEAEDIKKKNEKPATERKESDVEKQKEVEVPRKSEKQQPFSIPLATTAGTLSPTKKMGPTNSRPENITATTVPRKVNIYDENLSPLEVKLLCKYRKSCYEKGELPPILHAKTIYHLREKDEQHKPLELRCKYRKSCYETGKLPENLHENFKVVHLVEKKEEHRPLTLRCKYRKSCYETGILPPIEKSIFAFSTLQSMLNSFEDEQFTEKELTEDEKKLRCKYRKSCYETGKLPLRLNQTIDVIASSIKEQYMSPQLKCKYRKSCYESMKLDIQLDKVREKERQKKPQEGVVETRYTAEPATVKMKEKEQKEKVPEEELTDEEREQLRKERSKKAKKAGLDEEEYMQIEPLDTEKRLMPPKTRPLTKTQKLKCKYRVKCYDGAPLHQIIEEKRIETEKQVNIKDFRRANGAICNIYYISCRKQAGLPIRERAPIGPNGRRLCRKKKNQKNIQ